MLLSYQSKENELGDKEMQNLISNWHGDIEINGQKVDSYFKLNSLSNGPIRIVLYPNHNRKVAQDTDNKVRDANGSYRITVKPYMTKQATPQFDFMAKWNNDIPMPLMTMVGEKIKETNGMVYMDLHGDITTKITQQCLKCGKPITNDVSKYFGMGPKCGGHNYINPFNTEEELKSAVGEYRKKLQNIKWKGWMPKSAIIEQVEIINNG